MEGRIKNPPLHAVTMGSAKALQIRTDQPRTRTNQPRAVHSRMDRLATVFRTIAPDFFAAYETARVIIDRPATREDDEEPPAPQG